MKPRWVALLGRTGSVLLVVGLALALVSMIPSAPLGFTSSSWFTLQPRKYFVHFQTIVCSPQTGIRVSVTSNVSLQLYLLAMHHLQLNEWARSWVMENFPDLNESEIWQGIYNATVLEAFLQMHLEDVLLNETVNRDQPVDFFPSKVTNVTVVISNPSLMRVDVDVDVGGITTLAAKERVVLPAEVLIASGAILVLPWPVRKARGLR